MTDAESLHGKAAAGLACGKQASALCMGCIAFAEGICCNPSSSDRQRPEANMFREKIRRLRWVWMVLLAIAIPLLGQTPAKPTGPAPTAGGGAKKPGGPHAAPPPAAPQSKQLPILLVASGMEPQWSVRIGMKGAERLERAGYPPITLEPGEISADESGTAWNYRAKDMGTGADVTVRLSREACTGGTAEAKDSVRTMVTHRPRQTLNR